MVHVQMSPLIHVLDSSNRGSIAYDCLAFIMNNEACFRVVRSWHQFASSPTWLSNSLEVTWCATTADDLFWTLVHCTYCAKTKSCFNPGTVFASSLQHSITEN